MKHIFFLIPFYITSAVAMYRTDRCTDQVPQHLTRERTELLDYATMQGQQKKVKAKIDARCTADYEMQWRTWTLCARPFDVLGLHIQGYMIFVNPQLMRGTVESQNIKQLLCSPSNDTQPVRSQLASVYKIHLMPFDEDIAPIMTGLLQCITRDGTLQKAVSYFKVLAHTDQMTYGDTNLPIIVIYPHAHKEAAQYVLNAMYGLFKNLVGQNVTPRYNKQLSSLIYYAQGDGEFKTDQFAGFYEQDRVHYRPDFEGEPKNYYLQSPAEK